jgi:hypothetical protein
MGNKPEACSIFHVAFFMLHFNFHVEWKILDAMKNATCNMKNGT